MLMAAPLKLHQKQYIIQLLALGNTKRQINEKLKERYKRTVHPDTIMRIKKKHELEIADAHDVIAAGSEMVGATALKQKTYRLINRKLDRAIEDESDIDRLRAQLKAGEITKSQFDTEVARYEVLTINELAKLSDAMHTQSKNSDEDGALTPQDQAALQLLVEGIRSGNPMQLIQVLNPQVQKVYPNGENPVRQADTHQSQPA